MRLVTQHSSQMCLGLLYFEEARGTEVGTEVKGGGVGPVWTGFVTLLLKKQEIMAHHQAKCQKHSAFFSPLLT